MTCGLDYLVHASYSLPQWQAVKLTFFAPWGNSIVDTFFLISFTRAKENCITHKRDTLAGGKYRIFPMGTGSGGGQGSKLLH